MFANAEPLGWLKYLGSLVELQANDEGLLHLLAERLFQRDLEVWCEKLGRAVGGDGH
jgi:hypothetical protein